MAFVKQFSPYSSIVIKTFGEISRGEECAFPGSAVVASPQGLLLFHPSLALIPCNCVSLLLTKLTGNPMVVTYVLEPKGDRIRLWHFLDRALNMPKKYPIARRLLAL